MLEPSRRPLVRPIARIAAFVFFFALLPGGARVFAAVETYQDIPVTVRVGFTTFERGDAELEDDPTLLSITRYLEFLGERSRAHPYFLRRLDFEVVPGNHYQIHQWLSTGQLDAAIVSPFNAWLLERAGVARPVLELAGHESCCLDSQAWDRQGHRPMIRATWHGGELRPEPETVYSSTLRQLEKRISGEVDGDQQELDFQLHMTSHLAASGFIYPLLYAADWLDRSAHGGRVLSRAGEEVFWRTLLDRVVFDLHPDRSAARGSDGTALYFSRTGGTATIGAQKGWECYWLQSPESKRQWIDSPWVPNDVVVVRHDWDDRLVYRSSNHEENIEAMLPGREWIRKSFDPRGAYSDILDYDAERHEPFRQAVEKLLKRPYLADKERAWYQNGDFDFTLEDTLEFLDPGSHLGLVLPGGGVKSAYQAVLLDHLYGKPLLFNARARRPPAISPGFPLRVDRIVGTSGGAMMGFFAAQVDGTPCLSRLWRNPEDGGAGGGSPGALAVTAVDPCASAPLDRLQTVSSTDLFDLLDFPRWLSLLLLLLILHAMPFVVGGASSLLVRPFSGIAKWLEEVGGERLPWRWLVAVFRRVESAFRWVAERMAIRPAPDAAAGGQTVEDPQPPRRLYHEAALLAVVVAVTVPLTAPFLVAWLRGPRVEHIPQVEGLFFAALVVLGHMILICAKAGYKMPDRFKAARLAPLAVALAAALGLIATPFWMVGAGHDPGACWTFADGTLHGCSLAVLAGLLVILIVTLVAPRAGVPYRFEGVRLYWTGIGLLVSYILTVYAVLAALTAFDWASPLELTLVFWKALALCGVAVALLLVVVILGAAHRGRPRWLVDAMAFSITRQRIAGVSTTPRRTFFYAFVAGLVLWNALNAPAFYGNETMRGFFHQRIEAFRVHLASVAASSRRDAGPAPRGGAESEPAALDLKTALVVTGVLLGQTSSGGEGCSRLDPGEIFFCFDTSGVCPSERGSRWMSFGSFTQDEVADAVLASGSPFPIFAAHPVQLPNHCTVSLVDGGYTNNVPLEAADLAGVEQALIVYSQPVVAANGSEPAAGSPETGPQQASLEKVPPELAGERPLAGSLVRYSGRLFPFLFERAQEVDRRVAQEMVVISLAPLPESADGTVREFPLLSDFRKTTIRELDRWAGEDLSGNRRIGRVESWGKPTVERIVRNGKWLRESTQRIVLPRRDWDDRVRRALLKSVTDEADHKVAVLDLDGTCLDGDLGTWLFAEMVVGRALTGDDPELWKGLAGVVGKPGEELLEKAQQLWVANRETWRDSPFLLERPEEWNPDLESFVDLFRRLEKQAQDADKAELFHARLWNGHDDAAIGRFARSNLDMLPAKPVRVASWEGDSPPWQPWIQEVPAMRELIYGLRKLGWEVWIVGDAVEPAVRAAAKALGASEDKVIGFARDAGQFGPEPPWKLAKRRRLLDLGIEPWLVVADGHKDLELLGAARGLAVVIDRGEIRPKEIDGPMVFFQPPFSRDAASGGLKTAVLGPTDSPGIRPTRGKPTDS